VVQTGRSLYGLANRWFPTSRSIRNLSGRARPRRHDLSPSLLGCCCSAFVKSANQAGFLLTGRTPSVDGRPNFSRRSESEPFPKSGRLISVSSSLYDRNGYLPFKPPFGPEKWRGDVNVTASTVLVVILLAGLATI
jgi:hypothetical protein